MWRTMYVTGQLMYMPENGEYKYKAYKYANYATKKTINL